MITIRQLKCASLALCASALSSVDAQSLTITGRVVDSNEQPIPQAIVYLNPSKVAALTRDDGRYEMLVPDSIVRSQTVPLVAFKGGREMKTVMVVLAGHSIVHDFILPLDTLRKKKYGTALSPDLLMRSPGYALTISGRVVDDEGRGAPAVSVQIESMLVSTQTDSLGQYSLVVPEPTGKRVKLHLIRMGLLRIEDTVTLSGPTIHRDYAMRRPIYTMTATEVLALDGNIDDAAGLTHLATGPHRKGEREIRIRIFGGIAIPYQMYRFVDRSGAPGGEYIRYYRARNRDDEFRPGTAFDSAMRTSCKRMTYGPVFTCRGRFAREPNWRQLWKSLDSLDVWTIPDEGSLGKPRNLVFDGDWITAELWDGHSYETWSYGPGVEDDSSGRTRVTAIETLLREIVSNLRQ